MNKRLNFGGDPDHGMDTGRVFRIRHYWEIRKVVNEHKSAAAACIQSFIQTDSAAVVIIKLKNTDNRQLYLEPIRQMEELIAGHW